MKTRGITRSREVTEIVDGEEVTYDEEYTQRVPKIPFNLDALLRRGLFVLAVAMTAGAIVWGTVAIGGMLVILTPAWAAYLVAGVFDMAWAACLAAEYLARHDEKKATLPRNAGIGALVISMGAIAYHGHLEGALVVGIAGAAVSLVAKGVWFIAMESGRVHLDKGYQEVLRRRRQKAGLHQALAQSKRDQMIADAKTARLLAALEAEYGPAITTVERADVVNVDRADRAVDQGEVQRAELVDQAPDLRVDQSGPATDRPADRAVAPADQVALLVDKIREGEAVTKRSAAALLGVSETTAQRRLTEAKAKIDEGTGQYL